MIWRVPGVTPPYLRFDIDWHTVDTNALLMLALAGVAMLEQADAAVQWMHDLRKIQIPSPLLYCDVIGICANVRNGLSITEPTPRCT